MSKRPPDVIKLDRFSSRIAILTEVPYEHVNRAVKAMLIIMAQMTMPELKVLLGRYKKFKGEVPYDLDKIHE